MIYAKNVTKLDVMTVLLTPDFLGDCDSMGNSSAPALESVYIKLEIKKEL